MHCASDPIAGMHPGLLGACCVERHVWHVLHCHLQVMILSDFIFDMGFHAISVLASCQQQQFPLRVGFWRQHKSSAAPAQLDTDPSQASGFKLDPLLCNVEPVTHDALELTRLRSFEGCLTYTASPQRQCHTWTVVERPNARSIPLKRVFLRCAHLAQLTQHSCIHVHALT